MLPLQPPQPLQLTHDLRIRRDRFTAADPPLAILLAPPGEHVGVDIKGLRDPFHPHALHMAQLDSPRLETVVVLHNPLRAFRRPHPTPPVRSRCLHYRGNFIVGYNAWLGRLPFPLHSLHSSLASSLSGDLRIRRDVTSGITNSKIATKISHCICSLMAIGI